MDNKNDEGHINRHMPACSNGTRGRPCQINNDTIKYHYYMKLAEVIRDRKRERLALASFIR